MSFNKDFPITNNRLNEVDDINDNDNNIDDDHYYDNDQYNRFHPLKRYHQYHHHQSNTNNSNNNNNNNYPKNYNGNRQNNGISTNYQYYDYNTKWYNNENYHHQKQSIPSITTTVIAMATGNDYTQDFKRGRENSNMMSKKNFSSSSTLLPPPSYKELKHSESEQRKKNHLTHSTTNHNNNNNSSINKSIFSSENLNTFNNINKEPTNNSNINRFHNQNQYQHKQMHQQLNQSNQIQSKLFETFLFPKNIIYPEIEIDNNKSTAEHKTMITNIKNSTLLLNQNSSIPTQIRKGQKSIQKNCHTFNNSDIDHHYQHNSYNKNYNDIDNSNLNEDDEYDSDDSNGHHDESVIIKKKVDIKTKIRDFTIEFLKEVSAHGFTYLARAGLHIIERIIWILIIAGAIFGIISLGQRIWDRFQTSPMVITMDRNKLVWNTSFPSLTVCPYKRIDEGKVEEYLESRHKHFQNEEDREMFREFVNNLAHASYDNIEKLIINKTFDIKSSKYRDLLHELKWNFSPEMSSGTPVKMHIYETITELGVCHTVNSMIARYNSYEYWKYNNWAQLDHGDKVTVHPLDGEIYAQIINLSTAYDVYFHGAMEVPDISKQKYTFPETDYTTVELTALEIFTAKEARDFSIKQRKCRFHYEAQDMMTSPIYTFGLCRTECRMRLSLKICKCVPHFYRNHVRNGQTLPVCGIEGFSCLSKIKREIISLKSDYMQIKCDCQPNCDDSNFFVQSYKSRIWFLGANLQWGISNYPKMQLRREILFTFADVLVYIGGLAGFFLGCSILSFTEFIYFLTARLFKRVFLH